MTTVSTPPNDRASRPLPLAQPSPPPFPLIAGHFAAGFSWLVAGSVGLVWLAPALAGGASSTRACSR